MQFYSIPSTSFGRLLSESLIVGNFASCSNLRLFGVTQENICNTFILEVLSDELSIGKSPILRKMYSFASRAKLNFLLLNHEEVFEEEFFFKLLKAQRKYRERFVHLSGRIAFSGLRKLESRPIILFAARTDDYWNSQNMRPEIDLSLRNSSIQWIESVLEMLIENSFSVIRIGTELNAELSIKSQFFFDYSLSELRTEKSDFGICKYGDIAVTTGGGISLLPSLMGVPSLMVNTGLFSDLQPQEYLSHYLPKSVHSISDNRALNTHELSKLDLRSMQRDSQYLEEGLQILEVTPEQALEAISDFYQMIARERRTREPSNQTTDKFQTVPKPLKDNFPKDIKLQDSDSVVGIKIHNLWRNFQSF